MVHYTGLKDMPRLKVVGYLRVLLPKKQNSVHFSIFFAFNPIFPPFGIFHDQANFPLPPFTKFQDLTRPGHEARQDIRFEIPVPAKCPGTSPGLVI